MKASELQKHITDRSFTVPVAVDTDPRVQRVREMFKRVCSRRMTVLDVGCADGCVLAPFAADHEMHGVDISEMYLAKAQQLGFKTRVHDLESGPLPYEADSFDLVFTGETIEHQVDTDWFLSEVARVLKTGGSLIVTYPNIRTPISLAMMLFADLPPMYSARYRSSHFRDFTLRIIKLALKTHGFRVQEAAGTHFYLPKLGVFGRGIARHLPSWASQVVVHAVKEHRVPYSAIDVAEIDIYGSAKGD